MVVIAFDRAMYMESLRRTEGNEFNFGDSPSPLQWLAMQKQKNQRRSPQTKGQGHDKLR